MIIKTINDNIREFMDIAIIADTIIAVLTISKKSLFNSDLAIIFPALVVV